VSFSNLVFTPSRRRVRKEKPQSRELPKGY
jgi:hypothetical protein